MRRSAASSCSRLGDRVRARPALQRLGRRARRLRGVPGARARRAWNADLVTSWPGSFRRCAARATARASIRRRRALPRPPGGPPAARAARAGAAARCRPRRPALERRGVARAARRPVAPRAGCTGTARGRLSPRGRSGGVVGRTRGALRAADRARAALRGAGDLLLGDLEPARPRRSFATAAATRSTSNSSGARARKGRSAAIDERRRHRCRRRCRTCRRRGLAGGGGRIAPGGAAALLRGAAVAGEPFEPDLAAAIAELPHAEGLGALDELIARDLVRTTPVPRQFVFRHPLVRRAVYEKARRAGGSRPTLAQPTHSPRGAPAAERAHHVEQYAGQGNEEAISLLLEAGDAPRRGLLPRPRAGSRRRCGSCPQRTSAGWTSMCPSRPRSAHSASSIVAVRHCWRRSSCFRQTPSRAGRADGAVRGRRALARPARGGPSPTDPCVGGPARRATADAAVLEIELAVDGLYERDFEQAVEMGRQAFATAQEVGNER